MTNIIYLIYLLLIIALANSTVIVQSNKRVIALAEPSGPRLFYIKESDGLLQSSSSSHLVTGDFESGIDALALDYHHSADLLFWSTRSGRLYSCNLTSSRNLAYVTGSKLIYTEVAWLPASLAVDYLADRIYVLDTNGNNLRLFGLKGDARSVLNVPARDYKPGYLEIDPSDGYIFLMDNGEFGKPIYHHILRMNLDGSEPKFIEPDVLTKENIIGKIGLDRLNKRIFISSVVQRKIFSMSYDGDDLRTIVADQAAISISVANNELFWVNAFQDRQGVAQIDGSAYKCIYDPKQGCQANSTIKLAEDPVILTLKALESSVDQNLKIEKSCRSGARQSCEQLCFSVKDGRQTCGCEIGWQVDGPIGCQKTTDFLIYEDNGVVRAACPGVTCHPFAPFQPPISFKPNERTGFDYDPASRKLYVGGREAIHQIDIDSGTSTRLLYQKGVFFGPLALDRVSKNLYYTEIEQRGNVSFYMLKVTQVGQGSAQRAEASSSLLWELGRVHTIAVHPGRGYIFVSAFNNAKKHFDMLRFHTDAKNATYLTGLKGATFISVDEDEDQLYVLDTNSSEIRSTDLKGHGVRRIGKALDGKLTGFIYHDGIIYLQNSTNLRKMNATSGEDLGEIDLFPYDRRMEAGVKLHVMEKPMKPGRNPCAEDNGGCDNFCFALPQIGTKELKKACICFDGVKCAGLVTATKNSTGE